jgi:S1-C subfamily serine protease
MVGRRGFFTLVGGGAVLALGACARSPGLEAAGTPVGAIAATGFAALQVNGATRGAAVGFDDRHVLTCAHVVASGGPVVLRRGLDGAEVTAGAVLRSRRMDLAVLRVPAGFLQPPICATEAPRSGEAVWAAGVPGLGSPVAQGVVEAVDAEMPGFGRGFTARMPVLMGYSGGPVVDRNGVLMGLTSALPGGGGASFLAFLTGADLDGLTARDRRVFVLCIQRAGAEARRLLG